MGCRIWILLSAFFYFEISKYNKFTLYNPYSAIYSWLLSIQGKFLFLRRRNISGNTHRLKKLSAIKTFYFRGKKELRKKFTSRPRNSKCESQFFFPIRGRNWNFTAATLLPLRCEVKVTFLQSRFSPSININCNNAQFFPHDANFLRHFDVSR